MIIYHKQNAKWRYVEKLLHRLIPERRNVLCIVRVCNMLLKKCKIDNYGSGLFFNDKQIRRKDYE